MFIDALQTPSAKTVVSTLTTVAATAVIVRSILRDYVPPELQHYVVSKLRNLIARSLSSQLTIVVHELDDEGLARNDLFFAAKRYLKPTLAPETTRFKATLPKKETNFAITMDRNQEFVDLFNGVKLKWKLFSSGERKWLELSFHGKHRDMVMEKYLSHVMERSKEVREETKALKLFTLKQYGGVRIIMRRRSLMRWSPWESVALDHPATFGTMAMEAEAKRAVMEDLERFVARRGFYRSVGRAWKRGYLLFGPPGTGKTSLVAAMANYLHFDVYELDLSSVRSNAELRKLVISMGNRSLLVVEDVDCAAPVTGVRGAGANRANRRRSQVTLSGMLNFIDGLWSSCGDERIIVLTTNHKEHLDPALLRPGRMDMHIHLTYCTPCGFRMLVSNYLGVTEHRLLGEIEQLVTTMKVTPGEIGEELLKNEEPDASLSALLEFLKRKKENEAKNSA